MSQEDATIGEELYRYESDVYRTAPQRASWFSRTFPTISFYRQFYANVFRSSRLARRGGYGSAEWSQTSHEVLESLESVGVEFEIRGVENIHRLETPCVFVGNHMSMCETMLLPSIIRPVTPVTFVVKKSLLEYPLFRHILGTRDPIAVTRDNPREDFKTVMEGGVDRIKKGISIVVFPQTTRALHFDPSQFNTIGVKLALRAKVPVIPIALRTDAWGVGKWLKDLGPIDPTKKVHFEFGEPIEITGRGSDQHHEIVDYIAAKLDGWGVRAGGNEEG